MEQCEQMLSEEGLAKIDTLVGFESWKTLTPKRAEQLSTV